MRAVALLIVVVGIFSASQALDLTEVGTQLVNSLVEKGKAMLANAAQNLLGSLMDKFGKRGLSPLRDAVLELHDKFGKLLDHGKAIGSKVFATAMDRLRALADKFHMAIGTVKDKAEITDEIDAVVDDHNEKQKRVISDLIEMGKGLLSGVVSKAKDALGKVKAKASDLVSGLIQKGVDIFGRRALSDHLQKIGNALAPIVSPFKDIVTGLGTTLKGHFSNLVDTVKGHVTALKDKLSGHISDLQTHGGKLVEHGKNALGALGEVVKDVVQQTVDSGKPHLDGLSKTLADAGKTVLNHFTGSDSN